MSGAKFVDPLGENVPGVSVLSKSRTKTGRGELSSGGTFLLARRALLRNSENAKREGLCRYTHSSQGLLKIRGGKK